MKHKALVHMMFAGLQLISRLIPITIFLTVLTGCMDNERNQVFVYDGTSTIQITDDKWTKISPQINNNGQVVFTGYVDPKFPENEIFFYDGTTTTIISDTSFVLDEAYEGYKLTDSGYVVWAGNILLLPEERPGPEELYLYDGSSTIRLTNNDYEDKRPDINEDGHVVWQGHLGQGDGEIFLYDGASTIQLTDDDYADGLPKIDDEGKVVWSRCEGDDNVDMCWDGEREVFLYDGTNTIQLTDNDTDDKWHGITKTGYVHWVGMSNGSRELFLYDGASTVQVSNNNFDSVYLGQRNHSVNANGHAVWAYPPDGLNNEIFFYDGTTTIQLTDNDYDDFWPTITDYGYVTWLGRTTGTYGLYDFFIYDGSSITQISDGNYTEEFSNKPNAHGQVAWGHLPAPDEEREIYFFDGSENIRISFNSWSDYDPSLNDSGYITYLGRYEFTPFP